MAVGLVLIGIIILLMVLTRHKPMYKPGDILQRFDEFNDPTEFKIIILKHNGEYYKYQYYLSVTSQHVLSCDWIDRNYRKIN